MSCEWPDCTEVATHTVTATLPDGSVSTIRVCRSQRVKHDTAAKVEVVRSRGITPPAAPDGSAIITAACGECGLPLDERRTMFPPPCPVCGSFRCAADVRLAVQTRTVPTMGRVAELSGSTIDGVRRLLRRFTEEDTFTRLSGTWGYLRRVVDVESDSYWEEITLSDGTCIITEARLRDHPS